MSLVANLRRLEIESKERALTYAKCCVHVDTHCTYVESKTFGDGREKSTVLRREKGQQIIFLEPECERKIAKKCVRPIGYSSLSLLSLSLSHSLSLLLSLSLSLSLSFRLSSMSYILSHRFLSYFFLSLHAHSHHFPSFRLTDTYTLALMCTYGAYLLFIVVQ